MYTVKGKKDYDVTVESGTILVDGQPFKGRIKHIKDNKYLINDGKRVREVELISKNGKSMIIKLEGVEYPFEIEDEMDRTIRKLGLSDKMASKITELKAPMPGLIVEIKVKEGQNVKKGEALMILEAMKMENTIKADHDGTVQSILVAEKDSVEKNQLLIRF